MQLPARGVAAFEAAIRFASAPTTRCRSAYLVEVCSNHRLLGDSSMRRAQQCRYFASSLPPNYRHSRLTIVRRGCKRSRIAGIHGEAIYTALTLRSVCSHSSCKPAMCGVKGQGPLRSLGGQRGPFSHVREWPPYPHPHTVWGNHNLVICPPAVFSINFLVPTVSNATSSSASPPIGVTEMTSPSPNVLWWIWSPEES